MSQKRLSDFESSGVECPVCNREFKSGKAFGPHFRATHPDKHVVTERIREAYGGNPKDALEEWYWQNGLSERQISERYDLPRDGLRDAFNRLGVEKEPWEKPYARYRMNTNGYQVWRTYHSDGSDCRMRVHRLIAVAEHGFEAVDGNVVHHKNGIKWDNRPENLEVMDERTHLQEHYEEREIAEDGTFK